jgi:hypothetical protein
MANLSAARNSDLLIVAAAAAVCANMFLNKPTEQLACINTLM